MSLNTLPLTSSHLRRLGASAAALALAATLSAAPGPLAPQASAQSLSLPSFVVIPTPIPGEPVDPAVIARTITEIHEQTNRERVAAGRAPVARSAALDAMAQAWSVKMAAEDRMYHNPEVRSQVVSLFGTTWRNYGENVLQNWRGATGAQLTEQWMDSFTHRVNLLDSRHTHLGVGVAVAPSGKLYATQNFVGLR